MAQYIEKAGSGILDMYLQCSEAGLRPPTFRHHVGCLIQTLWRPLLSVTAELTAEVRLLRALTGEMTRQELQQALDLKHDEHFRKTYLLPALEAGLVEMTIPDKPPSSRQKYRLSEEGRARLAKDAAL